MNAIGKKTLIIGCGGSGKSYLSTRLGELTGIPVIHLDRLYWLPGWVTRSGEEFDAILSEQCGRDEFIMDGNFMHTLPQRLKVADAVIWLDFSSAACVWGVLSRVRKYRGKVRPDMGDGCPERFSADFIKWVFNFRKNTRPKIVSALKEAQLRGVRVTVLKNRREVNRMIKAKMNEKTPTDL